MEIGYTAEQEDAARPTARVLREAARPGDRAELSHARGVGRSDAAASGSRCAPTAGRGSAGRRSTAARGARRSSSSCSSTSRCAPGAPVPMLTINTVGPTIMRFGTDEQKQFFLPKILAGDIHFCIGYSEPGAGTDLASLTTRAVRDGDEYVINGQKMWTSLAERRRLLLARGAHQPRGEEAPGHLDHHPSRWTRRASRSRRSPAARPQHQPGVLRRRARARRRTAWAARTTVGRSSPTSSTTSASRSCASGGSERALDEVRQWAQETTLPDGRRVIDQDWVQLNLARVHANLEVLRLMNWQVAWEQTKGVLDIGHCSSVKVFGTERNLEAWRLLMEVLGPVVVPQGRLARRGAALPARGHVPRHAHPHVRRRHERVAARPHLPVHPGSPESEPLMDFSFSPDQESLRDARAQGDRRRRRRASG